MKTEMDKAEALASALQLLMSNHAPHVWVWALRRALEPTDMDLFHRPSVEQITRQHAQVMMRVTEIYRQHASTPAPEGYHLHPLPSSTS